MGVFSSMSVDIMDKERMFAGTSDNMRAYVRYSVADIVRPMEIEGDASADTEPRWRYLS